MDATLRKQNGVHYTPPELAGFLARQTVACIGARNNNRLTILDPACGDGELLASLVEALRDEPKWSGVEIAVVGYETDSQAVELTRRRLKPLGLREIRIRNEDFLDSQLHESFDCVIANPPYVRTQILGSLAAQRLARKFRLTGRLDLYQAFAKAISEVLRSGGVLGLLTSNRFLTVKAGAAMRQLLRKNFELQQVFDLGDTRLFEAAVLPVIVTGVRGGAGTSDRNTKFHRVYLVEDGNGEAETKRWTVLEAIEDNSISGEIETAGGRFMIERGELLAEHDQSVWTLANAKTRRWLRTVEAYQCKRFGDLAEIKVGIKTTADAVFIRTNWNLSGSDRPESSLLRPLITHHDARRWSIEDPGKAVLYPYDMKQARRTTIELSKFPRAAAYFQQYRERLKGRKYVVDAGRAWFEIWVPHQPTDWARPKIVWPEISEQPVFFLDSSGAIVNGDCYWIKLREGVDVDWMYLMLAVANSSVATRFYDTLFHNKLYAGRRRFMTQYVNEFPLPELDSKIGTEIVGAVKRLVKNRTPSGEAKVERLVQESFGFLTAKGR